MVHIRSFQCQQLNLFINTSRISGQAAIRFHDPVAWDEKGELVVSNGAPHRLRRHPGHPPPLRSLNLNIDTDFPYLVLDVRDDESYPRNPGLRIMHWHEDLQFIYVLDGMIEVRTLDSAVQTQAGNGVFINQSVVHDVRRLGSCHYNSFQFPVQFLEFYPGSPAKALVDCVTENKMLSFLRFAPCVDWQNDVLSLLRELLEIERNKTKFHVYEVLMRLCSIWLLILKNMAAPLMEKERRTTLRMQKMLRCIVNILNSTGK